MFGPKYARKREALLDEIRTFELECVRKELIKGHKVLELGGNNGLQASLIKKFGCEVSSIDIAERPRPRTFHHPVIDYDGRNIPFPDASFDIVFSSNVLEHVVDLDQVLSETARVLKPGGVSIHVLPSSTWRWWTTSTYYLYYSEKLLKRIATKFGSSNVENMGLREIGRTLLFPQPHGEYSNAIAELYYFSTHRWRKVFERAGFQVDSLQTNHLFYTGYSALPTLSMKNREKMSRFLGASCNVFILKARQ